MGVKQLRREENMWVVLLDCDILPVVVESSSSPAALPFLTWIVEVVVVAYHVHVEFEHQSAPGSIYLLLLTALVILTIHFPLVVVGTDLALAWIKFVWSIVVVGECGFYQPTSYHPLPKSQYYYY
jgi:hypothetical protein